MGFPKTWLLLCGTGFLCAMDRARSRVAEAGDPPPAGDVALDTFFHGAVIGLDGTKVRLRYDFSTPDQRKDWVDGVSWNVPKDPGDGIEMVEGRLSIRGSTGVHHVAEWEGDLSVTCRMIPDGTKDIGAFLTSEDASSDYVSFTIGETYWHAWDNKAGGETGMMKFGKQYATNNGSFAASNASIIRCASAALRAIGFST